MAYNIGIQDAEAIPMHDTKYRKQAMLIWAAERESVKGEWRQTAADAERKLAVLLRAIRKLPQVLPLRRNHP